MGAPTRADAAHHRLGILAVGMGLLFVGVVGRLFQLQVLEGHSLGVRSRRQEFVRQFVPGHRGVITDRNGLVLADSVQTESVLCSPSLVPPAQRAALADALARSLGVGRAWVLASLRRGRPFWVSRGAKLEATAALKAMKLRSLSYEARSHRVYPQGELAAHVLGYTDIDGRGLDGVERSYQAALAGTPGEALLLRDAAGRRLDGLQEWVKRPVDGSGLRLTLDADLQHIAERELDKAWRKLHAKGGAIVVMDPYTGEILALASAPDFDPSRPGAFSQNARWNRAVGDAFEPGSTFKVVTAALALERGVVTPDTPIDCHQGRAEFFGRIVRDYGADHLGVVPFSTVLADSSNVGTVEVAMRIGARSLFDGMTRFGFGRPTEVDLPGETGGSLRPFDRWRPTSMAAIPFGQAFSCNLMRILVTYAAVANGGRLVRPHVVRQLLGPDGSVNVPDGLEVSTRVLNETVRRQLVHILRGVVDRGTGMAIALPGYSIAGKTGTAQKFDLRTRRYSMTASVSTFVGFVPAQAPVFVAAVMLDEPRGLDLGGWTSGPVFRSVMSAALTDYGIEPDPALLATQQASAAVALRKGEWEAKYRSGAKAEVVATVRIPDLAGLNEATARRTLARAGLRARVVGRGRVAAQFPRAGASALQNSTVTLSLKGDRAPRAPQAQGLLARLLGRP